MYKQLRDADMSVGYVGGWCLKYVQDAFGTDHPYPTAIAEWNATSLYNHTDLPPAGVTVPVFFSLGNVPAGHVAISLSDGFVASSTQSGSHSTPYFHKNLDDLMAVYGKYNGGCTYLGWSERVGSVQVVELAVETATADQVRTDYLEILERGADDGGVSHYTTNGMTNDQVRADLFDSAEYKSLQAHKQLVAEAASQAAKDAQDAADQKAKDDAAAAAQAQADTEARQKAIDAQKVAEAHTVPVQNVLTPTQSTTLYDWVATLVKVVINWLKQWKKS